MIYIHCFSVIHVALIICYEGYTGLPTAIAYTMYFHCYRIIHTLELLGATI